MTARGTLRTAILAACAAPAAARAAAPAAADDAPSVRLVKSIPMPGVEKRIDHLAIDAAGKRLVVAALGCDTVQVIDLEKGEVVHVLDQQAEPQGVAILPETGRIVVSNGEDGTVRFYDGATFEIASTIELGNDADNVRLDAATGRLYVGYGKGGISVIEKGKHLFDVHLKGHPEAFQLESKGNRVFVNVPTAGHVAVLDREKAKVVATLDLSVSSSYLRQCLRKNITVRYLLPDPVLRYIKKYRLYGF